MAVAKMMITTIFTPIKKLLAGEAARWLLLR
jgi:hypothetical protein